MARRERKYTWYIEALDSYTNMVVATVVGADTNFSQKICADKRRRMLWEVAPSLLTYIKRSKGDLKLKFNIFVQEGNGKIRLRNMPFKKIFKKKIKK